jgi:hypothetical protein
MTAKNELKMLKQQQNKTTTPSRHTNVVDIKGSASPLVIINGLRT